MKVNSCQFFVIHTSSTLIFVPYQTINFKFKKVDYGEFKWQLSAVVVDSYCNQHNNFQDAGHWSSG